MSRPSSVCSEASLLNEFSEVSLVQEDGVQKSLRNGASFTASSPFPQSSQEQIVTHSGHPISSDQPANAYSQPNQYIPPVQQQQQYQDSGRFFNASSYVEDPRRAQTQPNYNGQDQFRRALTPVGQNPQYDYIGPLGIQRPMNSMNSMNQTFGSMNQSFNDYGRGQHDMSRSYQNISSFGGQPIMSSMPYGGHPSQPYPNATPYNQFPAYQTQQPQNGTAQFQEWMVKYTQWWSYMNNQRLAQSRLLESGERQRLTPHRFPHRHSRVCFGSTNQLLVISGNNVNIQQLDPSLIDVNETVFVSTWPGPLIKGETEKGDVIEYIRTQEGNLKNDEHLPEDYAKSHQKKQIWLLLSMLVRQNGLISGADLSELLLSNNESEFEFTDEGTEIAKLRRYLLLGQKKTALEFATKCNLWGHAFALTHLNSKEAVTGPMNGMVSKFVNGTLSREDPLYVLFRCLLQKLQDKAGNKLVPTANLQQFAMLLANDCDVSPIISNSSQSAELLKFIVALRNNSSQVLVNLPTMDNAGIEHDDRGNRVITYSDELVFTNEIWEFSRNVNEFIEALVPLKLIFAARLFDYGFLTQATRYCYVIRQYHSYYNYYFQGKTIEQSSINWDVILNIVNDMECRLYGFDVTAGKGGPTVTADKEASSTNEKNDDEKEDENEEEDDEDEEEEESIEEDDVDNRQVERKQEVLQVVQQRPPDKLLPVVSKIARGQSETNIGQNQNALVNHPKQLPATTINNTFSQKARSRTQTEESLKHEAPPPLTPSVPAAANTMTFLPQTYINQNQQPLESLSSLNSKPTLFVPPIPSTADTADFNFVSTYTPVFSQANNMSVPSDQSPDGTGDDYNTANDYAGDGRYSAPLNEEPAQPWNSTAMPTYNGGLNNDFGAPFSPINSPEPEQLSHGHQSNVGNNLSNGSSNANSNTVANETENSKQSQQQPKLKGWFGSIMEKVVPQGPKRAILPDDKNPTITYDDNLKRWVNKDDPSDGGANDALLSGPPRMPGPMSQSQRVAPVQPTMPMSQPMAQPVAQPMSQPMAQPMAFPAAAGPPGTNNFSFVKNARPRQRYVDAWQANANTNTQQPQQKAS